MARIGFFRAEGDEFHGSIVTLSVQHSDVRIVPNKSPHRDGESRPSHRVFAGAAEVGSGWEKADSIGKIISLKVDDPSFYAPIYPTLITNDDGEWVLIWRRGEASTGPVRRPRAA